MAMTLQWSMIKLFPLFTSLWEKVSKSKAADVQERARFMERVESTVSFHLEH